MENKLTTAAAALKEQLDARNAAFWQMTRAEQAVAVAKDVIEQVQSQKYYPSKGTYLKMPDLEKYEGKKLPASLQEVLETQQCDVCAIGGVFASMVRLGNTVRTYKVVEDCAVSVNADYLIKKLEGIFSPTELRAMEFVFEGTNVGFDRCSVNYSSVSLYAKDMRSKYPNNPTARLVAVMQNVVDNGGRFVVPGAAFKTHK